MGKEHDAMEEATRLAGEVMGDLSRKAQAENQQQPRTTHVRRAGLLTATVAILLGALLVSRFFLAQPRLTDQEELSYLRDDMSLLVFDLADYLEANRAYPASLSQIGLDDSQAALWRYERLAANHFRLQSADPEQTLVFDSKQSADEFFADVRGTD